jgi:hypothetical protein
MKNYGRVRSTVNPKPMVIDEFSVWIHKNITEVSENVGEENEFIGYEYDMIQYEKDEYIELLSEQNETFLETLDTLMSEVIPSLMM